MKTNYRFICTVYTTEVDFVDCEIDVSAHTLIDALNELEELLLNEYYPFHSVELDPIYKFETLGVFAPVPLSRFLKYGFDSVVGFKCQRIGDCHE